MPLSQLGARLYCRVKICRGGSGRFWPVWPPGWVWRRERGGPATAGNAIKLRALWSAVTCHRCKSCDQSQHSTGGGSFAQVDLSTASGSERGLGDPPMLGSPLAPAGGTELLVMLGSPLAPAGGTELLAHLHRSIIFMSANTWLSWPLAVGVKPRSRRRAGTPSTPRRG
jgi:hypothetical protein